MQSTGKYEHVYVDLRKPEISFGDIAGYESVKEKFMEMLVFPFKFREAFEKANLKLPSGVICWGPLGIGKGHLIEASAKEAGVNFVIIRGRETTANAEAIREGFKVAKKNKPCIIHVMDIDWLAPRSDANYTWSDGSDKGKPDKFGTPEVRKALYNAVADVAYDKEIMVAASCYRIDVLDQAYTRTGMLGRKIYVPRPGREDRKKIIMHYLKKQKHESIDFEKLAELTRYYVGWDLEALCRKASLISLKRNGKEAKISMKDFEEALKYVKPWLSREMAEDYDKIFSQDCQHKYNF